MTTSAERQAKREAKTNERYTWIGEKPRWQTIRILARSRLLVLSSASEGGANVVSEALACNVPVLSTHIPGSVGLLGKDYPGYFPYGDTGKLAHLLHHAETDPGYYANLRSAISARRVIVRPARERSSLESLLQDIVS